MPGCYVARFEAAWLVDVDTALDDDTFGVSLDQVPEISVDPGSKMLSVINSSPDACKSFNLTLSGSCLPVVDGKGNTLQPGVTLDETGAQTPCISLVLVVKPKQMMDVCFVNDLPGATSGNAAADLASDVQFCPMELPGAAALGAEAKAPTVGFPLGGPGPYLCSQGACGHFTHYFPGNCFAIDLECPVGTPVLAVGAGRVVGVRQHESVEGIHARNLFHWNSLQLQLDAGAIVEYVHIQKDSAVVSEGDVVAQGALLCTSGAVGFVPCPHLHLQMLQSLESNAPSVPFRISCKLVAEDHQTEVEPHVCRAGYKYASGSLDAASITPDEALPASAGSSPSASA